MVRCTPENGGKKMKKNVTAVCTLAVMCAIVTGCGSKTDNSSATQAQLEATTAAETTVAETTAAETTATEATTAAETTTATEATTAAEASTGETKDIASLADGSYHVQVELEGGSGKVKIEDKSILKIENGQYLLTITWSSSKYDYMRIGEEKYLPINTEGNSTFEIPVAVLDEWIPVVADTIAMSTPKEIEYQIKIVSESLKAVE